jgi:hypothetical protein
LLITPFWRVMPNAAKVDQGITEATLSLSSLLILELINDPPHLIHADLLRVPDLALACRGE